MSNRLPSFGTITSLDSTHDSFISPASSFAQSSGRRSDNSTTTLTCLYDVLWCDPDSDLTFHLEGLSDSNRISNPHIFVRNIVQSGKKQSLPIGANHLAHGDQLVWINGSTPSTEHFNMSTGRPNMFPSLFRFRKLSKVEIQTNVSPEMRTRMNKVLYELLERIHDGDTAQNMMHVLDNHYHHGDNHDKNNGACNDDIVWL